MAPDETASLAHARPEIGFSTRYVQLLVVGAALVVLGGFLTNLVAVSNPPSSLLHLAQWSGWLGAVTVSASLLLAGVTGHGTSPGVRTALVLGGSYLLLTTSDGLGFLARMLF